LEVIINNIKINYIKEGNGPKNILLLHGWGSNYTLFDKIIKFLSQKHTVYALDLPGFGSSDLPSNPWNVDDYTKLVIEFIKLMKIDKLSLLGHSFGGRIIIKLNNINNLSFEIEKNILIDSAGIKPKQKRTLKNTIYKILKKVVGNKLVKKLFPNAIEKIKRKFGSADYRSAVPVMRDTLVKVVNEDLKDYLPNMKRPTLLIWGTNDTATPLEDAMLMGKLIPDAGLVKIEGAGHYSFLEKPQLVNSVLEAFFKP